MRVVGKQALTAEDLAPALQVGSGEGGSGKGWGGGAGVQKTVMLAWVWRGRCRWGVATFQAGGGEGHHGDCVGPRNRGWASHSCE
jgi:hypothetical protein